MKSWLNTLARYLRGPQPATVGHRLRPCVELLENRLVPTGVATFTVTTASDFIGHTGVSLRDAVTLANNNADPGTVDVINFAPGLSGKTILLQQGVLPIFQSVKITGLGATKLTIDGNSLAGGEGGSQIFNLADGGEGGISFTVQNLTLTHGNGFNGFLGGEGGPFGSGGGAIGTTNASSTDHLIVQNCILTKNRASNGGAILDVGANLLIQDSVIANNRAGGGGGGIAFFGSSSPSNAAPVLSFELDRTLLSANHTENFGGGLSILLENGAPVINGCAFLNNGVGGGEGSGSGGAIGLVFAGDTTIQNTTMAGNTAAEGGAIDIAFSGLLLRNDTITHNVATNQGSGGIYASGPSGTAIFNSILEENFLGHTPNDIDSVNFGQPAFEVQYSLVQAPQAGTIPNAKAQHDIVGVPAQLVAFTYHAPLSSYTLYTLASTSPARKAGNAALSAGLITDEIGNPRTQTIHGVIYIDMGAIESLDLHRLHF